MRRLGAHVAMSPRLFALSFGNFVIGTGTLIVPGMLPALADGLGLSLHATAQLITAFAITVCVGAPLLAGVTSRYDRRALLVSMQILFFAGHVASALVSSFGGMLLTRIASSVGAALFTSQAAVTAALLVPPAERGRAIAFVFVGWSIAQVIGMPLGAYVGATLGWRAGFALVAIGSLAAAGAVGWTLPRGLEVKSIDRTMWRSLVAHPAIIPVLAVTVVNMSAQFALFSYFVPAAHAFVDASPTLVSMLLAAFGATAVIGNIVAGRLVDRVGAARVVAAALLVMLAAHLLWPFSPGALPVLLSAVLAWGTGCFAVNSAQQVRLVTLSPAHAPVSIALNTSGVYLGQAIGTVAGGVLLARVAGAAGYASLAWLSVPLFVLALGLSIFASRRSFASAPA